MTDAQKTQGENINASRVEDKPESEGTYNYCGKILI